MRQDAGYVWQSLPSPPDEGNDDGDPEKERVSVGVVEQAQALEQYVEVGDDSDSEGQPQHQLLLPPPSDGPRDEVAYCDVTKEIHCTLGRCSSK